MKEEAEETRPKIRMKKLKREERGEAKEPGMIQVVPEGWETVGLVNFLDVKVHHDGTERLE